MAPPTQTPNDDAKFGYVVESPSATAGLKDAETDTKVVEPADDFDMEGDDLLDECDDTYPLNNNGNAEKFTDDEINELLHSDKEGFLDEDLHSLKAPITINYVKTTTSNTSMANKLGTLTVQNGAISKSGSSKRKALEGDDDTASSNLMGTKKPKL